MNTKEMIARITSLECEVTKAKERNKDLVREIIEWIFIGGEEYRYGGLFREEHDKLHRLIKDSVLEYARECMLCDLDTHLESERFIDDIVSRINRKQLKGENS